MCRRSGTLCSKLAFMIINHMEHACVWVTMEWGGAPRFVTPDAFSADLGAVFLSTCFRPSSSPHPWPPQTKEQLCYWQWYHVLLAGSRGAGERMMPSPTPFLAASLSGLRTGWLGLSGLSSSLWVLKPWLSLLLRLTIECRSMSSSVRQLGVRPLGIWGSIMPQCLWFAIAAHVSPTEFWADASCTCLSPEEQQHEP